MRLLAGLACISLVGASFDEGLLARQSRRGLQDVPDFMERWETAWAKQIPLNLLRGFSAPFARTAVAGILGDLISTLIIALWPPSGSSPTQALLEFILQWTQDYVNIELIKTLNDLVRSDMDTMKKILGTLKVCLTKLKHEAIEETLPFPTTRLDECLGIIERAKDWGDSAMNKVKNSHVRAGAIAIYLVAWTSVLSVWSEHYKLMVFFDKWRAPTPVLSWLYTSEEVRMLMDEVYENRTRTLQDIVDDFWPWRMKWITVDRSGDGLKWHDRLTGGSRWLGQFLNGRKDEVQDAAMKVLKGEIFVNELAPMLKTWTTLHRLLPGRSEESPARGPFFPERIYLGPYSSFIMGAARVNKEDLDTFIHPSLNESSSGSIYRAGGRTGSAVDQLLLRHGDGAVTKIGSQYSGNEIQELSLPPFTCGVEIAYRHLYMNGVAFINIKNQSMSIQGSNEKHGGEADRFHTGPGLCGLYTLHQFHHYPKVQHMRPYFTLSRGVVLSFKWEPVTEEDF